MNNPLKSPCLFKGITESACKMQLIDRAFDHLICQKFGEQDAGGAGPSGLQVEGSVGENNEDDAFESERAQMRAAMQQSVADAAAYNAINQKPEEQWSSEDYKKYFPSSIMIPEVLFYTFWSSAFACLSREQSRAGCYRWKRKA